MEVLLLVNPSAGQGDHAADDLREAIESAGHSVVVHSAKRKQLQQALEDPRELVVVAGGDGTVGRAIAALAGCGVPLAILPFGTANNIATSLGIRGTPAELAARWPHAPRRRVDVGTARGPWGETRFVESVGVGLLSRLIAPEVGDEIDNTALARETARRLARTMVATRCRVELDGEDLSGEYLLLEAMNIRCAGPNLWLADHAHLGDGQLEVVIATEKERTTLVALADAFGTSRPFLPHRPARRFSIWCEPDDLHVDDEHGGQLDEWRGLARVDVELGHRGVDVLV
ncbi:MAG TPA: diacylglycerol kinase family protein [Gemmatimonadales bacterium]|nr:diacylglycerol kinase family protein [Gemmatimonadales bacterium]